MALGCLFRGLANAFSRVACGQAALERLAQRLRREALLPPVAAAMALNAFAVLKIQDPELFEALLESSVRRGKGGEMVLEASETPVKVDGKHM